MVGKRVGRILAATKEAPGGNVLDFDGIDTKALDRHISGRVAICLAGHDVGDAKKRRDRQERRLEFHRIVRRAQTIYKTDDGVPRIAQCYPRGRPEPLQVLADLESAAERAMKPPKDPPELQKHLQKWVSELNEAPLSQTLIAELIRTFEKHFKKKATRINNIHRSPGPDSPFIRFVEAVFSEYGITTSDGEPYARTTIGRCISDIRAGRSRRKRDS